MTITTEQVRDTYQAALASLTPAQAWALELKLQAETMAVFPDIYREARLWRLFAERARSMNAALDPNEPPP